MKKNMKKNNKGFSLVELIVVVLIMGIIAVALAPQVMKWVGTSRENSDKNQINTIKSSVQVAVAEYQATNGSVPSGFTAAVDFDATSVAGANSAFASILDGVVGGEYPTPAGGSNFTITIDGTTGQVTVATE